jgi:hypothetical protein
MTNSKSGDNQIIDTSSPNSEQVSKLKRIDKHYISHEVLHLLHFEKGFFYSIKALMTKPGESIKEFLYENRTKHMKPVPFLILTSLLFTLISHLFHADEIYNEKEKLNFGGSSIGSILEWVQLHYGYANIMSVFPYALCVKLFFLKYKYNFFEIAILLCFVMGQAMLLLTFEVFFVGLLNKQVYTTILTLISIAYPTWAIGHFFDKTKIFSYVKAFFAYCLGYLLFYFIIIIVGLIVDIIKHLI